MTDLGLIPTALCLQWSIAERNLSASPRRTTRELSIQPTRAARGCCATADHHPLVPSQTSWMEERKFSALPKKAFSTQPTTDEAGCSAAVRKNGEMFPNLWILTPLRNPPPRRAKRKSATNQNYHGTNSNYPRDNFFFPRDSFFCPYGCIFFPYCRNFFAYPRDFFPYPRFRKSAPWTLLQSDWVRKMRNIGFLKGRKSEK